MGETRHPSSRLVIQPTLWFDEHVVEGPRAVVAARINFRSLLYLDITDATSSTNRDAQCRKAGRKPTVSPGRACMTPKIGPTPDGLLPFAARYVRTAVTIASRQGEVVCIVVIEDEPDVREMLRLVLEDEGYEVFPIAHPASIEPTLESAPDPDAFLIDIMLPGMSGIEVAARLDDEGFATTPKIAMSASQQGVVDARASGHFDAAIEKPFDLASLAATVEQCLAA
jgi:CheY-like chemotaxis protein